MNMHVFDVLESHFKRKSRAPLVEMGEGGDGQHPGSEEVAQGLRGLAAPLLQRTRFGSQHVAF